MTVRNPGEIAEVARVLKGLVGSEVAKRPRGPLVFLEAIIGLGLLLST